MRTTIAPPPREPRRAEEIAAATLALLAERGYDDLTIEGVAERSGVNKTTIYRWWPSKAALVGAAVRRGRLLEFSPPDTGRLRGDLEALTAHVSRLLTTPPTAQIARALLSGAARSPQLAEQTDLFFAERLEGARVIIDRAVARGELPADRVDPAVLLDLLNGALWMRVVIRRAPIASGFAAEIVGIALTGALGVPEESPQPAQNTARRRERP